MITYKQKIKRFLQVLPKYGTNITEKNSLYFISPEEIWVDTEINYSNINYFYNISR